jgi:hypothetical protein
MKREISRKPELSQGSTGRVGVPPFGCLAWKNPVAELANWMLLTSTAHGVSLSIL